MKKITVQDLFFVDDAAFVAQSFNVCNVLLTKFFYCSEFGKLRIYFLLTIKIGHKCMKNMKSFVYIGSNIVSNESVETEISFLNGRA